MKELKNEIKGKIKSHDLASVGLGLMVKVNNYPMGDTFIMKCHSDRPSTTMSFRKTIDMATPESPLVGEAITNLSLVFLGSIYELIKDRVGEEGIKKLREEPVFEFFYHCRNAAFHNNKFVFTFKGRRRLPKNAKWRNLEITEADEGKKLFYDKLDNGDPKYLIEDILSLLD